MATVATLAAIVSAGKTIAAEVTGVDLVAGQFLFYAFATSLALYFSVLAGAFVAGGIVWVCETAGVSEDSVQPLIIGVWLVVSVGMAVALVANGGLFDWRDTSHLGRVVGAACGLACLAAPAWIVAVKTQAD